MLKRVHHINFVVRDLEKAVEQYQSLLGTGNFEYLDHPHRPVKIARCRIGESWIVLVQPLDTQSPPARHLQQHGEGFFLLSFEVNDIEQAMREITSRGGRFEDKAPRPGILNWQVADLCRDDFGLELQLVQETN